MRDAREFWSSLEHRLPPEDRGREREIAREVLTLLRRRLRPEEAQHVTSGMPDELKSLWATHGIGVAEEHTAREIEELDHNAFVGRVRDAAAMPDMARAAHATEAVFGALRRVIPDAECDHIEHQLPAGLKALWRGEHRGDGRHFERGSSPFWDLLDDRLDGRVRAAAGDVACSVLAHLRGRLSAGTARRVRDALPEELRLHWVAPEPGAEADEQPERFWGRVAQELDVDDASARHAATAALGSLRRVLPDDVARAIRDELPDDLRGFWEGM